MNANCYYFLVVAEELNISKAAKRLYISQQCLSNHIKRLEENYGVLLLNRKPRLSLTPAGEAVVRNFQRVQILEGSLQTELREIEDGRSGKIHLGIQAARAGIVIPEIITQHRKLYPGIEIIIDNGFVSDLEQQVISGKLDLFLGINPASHPLLNEIPLMKEQMYLAVTDWMLKKYFPTQFPDIKERLKKGADLRELTHLPFLLTHEGGGKVDTTVQRFLDKSNLNIHCAVKTNSTDLRIQLSAMNIGVCMIQQMFLPLVMRVNTEHDDDHKLNLFPIRGLENMFQYSLVHHKDLYLTRYTRDFISIAVKVCEDMFRDWPELVVQADPEKPLDGTD